MKLTNAILSKEKNPTKEYSGDPHTSVFTPYTEAEVLAFLETGWGIGNVEDLRLSFLYSPEDDQ